MYFLVLLIALGCVSEVTAQATPSEPLAREKKSKKKSRARAKEEIIGTLEDLGHELTSIVRLVGCTLEKSHHEAKKHDFPSIRALRETLFLLKTGSLEKGDCSKAGKQNAACMSTVLKLVADIQDALMNRVKEVIEDDGAGVFTSMPYGEFVQLSETLTSVLSDVRAFSCALRNDKAVID